MRNPHRFGVRPSIWQSATESPCAAWECRVLLSIRTLEQGANDFVSSFTSTLDMLAGDFAQEIWILGGLMFGISDAGTNPITVANNYMQETTRKEAEYYAQNASGSKTAENLNKYGTVVASALPTLAMAMMTGGISNAGMAKEGIEKAAFMAKSTDFSRYVDMANRKEPECADGVYPRDLILI